MPAFIAAAPVDTRSIRRLPPEASGHSVPVVRETPRPVPDGLGNDLIW